MEYRYQQNLESPSSPPRSPEQRPGNRKKKRSAHELGTDSGSRRTRPFYGSDSQDVTQAQTSNVKQKSSSSGSCLVPRGDDMDYSFSPTDDTEIARSNYRDDIMYGAEGMRPHDNSWSRQADPLENHVSNSGGFEFQGNQDIRYPFQEETNDFGGSSDVKNDASDLFVDDDDDDDYGDDDELEESEEESEEEELEEEGSDDLSSQGTSKKSVHYEDERTVGLGQSILRNNKKQHNPPGQYHQPQPRPRTASFHQPQDIEPVNDSQGNIRSSQEARQQQQYTQNKAHQGRAQAQQSMDPYYSLSQHISPTLSAPDALDTAYGRTRDPRLMRREGQVLSPTETLPNTSGARVLYPAATRERQSASRARTEQDHRARMSVAPVPRPNLSPVVQSKSTRVHRWSSTPDARPTPQPVPPIAPTPTPSRFAKAPFLKPSGTGKHGPANRKPMQRSSGAAIRPTPAPQPDLQAHDLGFSEADVQKFEPNKMDKQIYDWRVKGLGWDNIMTLLKLANQGCSLSEIQVRQKLLIAKLSMPQARGDAPNLSEIPTIDKQEAENSHTALPAGGSVPVVPVVPVAPAVPAAVVRPQSQDTLSFAALREKEKLAWQEEKKDLQQCQQQAEEQLIAERLKTKQLREELEQERIRSGAIGKLEEEVTKQKEENQELRERLKDEQLLRKKAEKDWKDSQKTQHNRTLAQAAASRRTGKAQFASTEAPEERATPARSRSRKTLQPDVREDGNSKHGGKTISQAMYQQWMKHVQRGDADADESEDLDQEMPEQISEDSLTYFVYTLRRKQWLKNEEEPEVDGIVCGQYTYLNAANKAAQEEVLRPFGNDGIAIEQDKDYTLHGGRDADTGMCWAQLEVSAGSVKTWVERVTHTSYRGKLPQFEPNGMLSKFVFVVKREVQGVVDEEEQIYTTFDFANKKASDTAFELVWREKKSQRLDDIMRRSEAEKSKAEKLEDLEDRKQLFFEEIEHEDGRAVKIWVVKRQLVGPRN